MLHDKLHGTVKSFFAHRVRKSGVIPGPHDIHFIADFEVGIVITVNGVDDFAVFFEFAEKASLFIGEAGDKLGLATVGVIVGRCIFLEKEEKHYQENDDQKNNSKCFHFSLFLDLTLLALRPANTITSIAITKSATQKTVIIFSIYIVFKNNCFIKQILCVF